MCISQIDSTENSFCWKTSPLRASQIAQFRGNGIRSQSKRSEITRHRGHSSIRLLKEEGIHQDTPSRLRIKHQILHGFEQWTIRWSSDSTNNPQISDKPPSEEDNFWGCYFSNMVWNHPSIVNKDPRFRSLINLFNRKFSDASPSQRIESSALLEMSVFKSSKNWLWTLSSQ